MGYACGHGGDHYIQDETSSVMAAEQVEDLGVGGQIKSSMPLII